MNHKFYLTQVELILPIEPSSLKDIESYVFKNISKMLFSYSNLLKSFYMSFNILGVVEKCKIEDDCSLSLNTLVDFLMVSVEENQQIFIKENYYLGIFECILEDTLKYTGEAIVEEIIEEKKIKVRVI